MKNEKKWLVNHRRHYDEIFHSKISFSRENEENLNSNRVINFFNLK